MTIPVLKYKSLTTGEICTIPSEEGYAVEMFTFMASSLENPVGTYRYNNLNFYVYETSKFKYCALLDEVKSNSKGKKTTIKYTIGDVEEFCSSIENFAEENFSELISYAHDVQYTIGALVHKSVVNKRNTDDINKLRQALIDINVLAAILSAKDCFFRYRAKAFSDRVYSISVVGKFFKIQKAFEDFGKVKDKELTFTMNAHHDIPTIDTFEIFDFIPYILLENAVKYAPNNSDIDIDITKHGDKIVATIGSMGPALRVEEYAKIFEKGYRGEVASSMDIKGQGLGLYHLSEALKDLNLGYVNVRQQNSTNMNGFEYSYTEFSMTLNCRPLD